MSQKIVGLDLGTSEFGLSVATDDLKQSVLYRPSSNKLSDLNSELLKLREGTEFFGIVYGSADKDVWFCST